MFIALYGINNIGKTYHAKRLVERLNRLGKKAIYIKYPVYDLEPTGPFLNALLRKKGGQKIREEELQLWFVLNRYQFEPTLKKWLSQGIIVVAEDYTGTGIAWGHAKGVSLNELENMNKFLVQPDVNLLLEGRRKLQSREQVHVHEQNDQLIERCRKVFQKLGKKYAWRHIQVAEDKEVTAERIWKQLQLGKF